MTASDAVVVPPPHPLLVGLYHVVALDEERVLVCNAGRSVVLSGAGPSPELAAFLGALDGRVAVDELQRRHPDVDPRVLQALADKGMVVEGALDAPGDGDGREHWASTVAALGGRVSAAHVAHRLPASTVVFVGCGPIAAAAAVLVARAGVGRLVLADSAPVPPQGAALCPVWPKALEGMSQSDATARVCEDSSGVRAEAVAPPAVNAMLPDADLVVAWHLTASDGATRDVADVCLALGVPYLLYGQDALEAVVGPLVMPGGQPCHRCLDARRLSHIAHHGEYLAYLEHRRGAVPAPDVFLAGQVAVVAGLLATEVVRHLTGAPARTPGGALVVDLAQSVVEHEEVLPVPRCEGCELAVTASR